MDVVLVTCVLALIGLGALVMTQTSRRTLVRVRALRSESRRNR